MGSEWGTLTGVVLVAVTVFVSVAACVTVRLSARGMRPNPWAAPGFPLAFATWVLESMGDRIDGDDGDTPGPAPEELARVVAVLARPVAPPRRHLRVA